MFRKLKNRNLVMAFDGWIMLLCLQEIQRNNTRLFRDLSFGFLNLEVVTSERYLTSRWCAVTIPIHRLLSGPSWSMVFYHCPEGNGEGSRLLPGHASF